jgi:hypothetical protein
MKRLVHTAIAILAIACIGASTAATASATGPTVVDLAQCARPVGVGGGGGGNWSVPAGVPVTVTNLSVVNGTFGLLTEFLHKQSTITGFIRGGVPSITDVTDEWSQPQMFDPGAQHAGWFSSLPDIDLAPLAAGESVDAGTLITLTRPVEIAFQPVGKVNFGPFHLAAGDELGALCTITAV